jgi:hypothetical protein
MFAKAEFPRSHGDHPSLFRMSQVEPNQLKRLVAVAVAEDLISDDEVLRDVGPPVFAAGLAVSDHVDHGAGHGHGAAAAAAAIQVDKAGNPAHD